MNTSTTTGSWIAIAGLIVAGLSHFGVIIDQNTIVTIISGAVALYGVIHQWVVTKSVVKSAIEAGVKGIK